MYYLDGIFCMSVVVVCSVPHLSATTLHKAGCDKADRLGGNIQPLFNALPQKTILNGIQELIQFKNEGHYTWFDISSIC
ncbi:hypothetical protein E2C01_007850 [Portunus trituberculatus]|uniref:Uncharacterized protein n=1 Tax=Portunus trituberculatus TaxID=210409 RepID=A0A5B7CZ72_PORTR|nr:hypothetical protein [Portunus trituberculatus]